MPSTYPPGRLVTQGALKKPSRPPFSPHSSFLSPVQEARILSWRQSTTSSPPPPKSPSPTPKPGPKGVQSAPASINHSHSSSAASSCPIHGTCSCTAAAAAAARGERPKGPKVRSYYSRKKSSAPSSESKSTLVMTPVTAQPHGSATPVSAAHSPHSKGSRASTPAPPHSKPDTKGVPSSLQIQAYRLGAPPPPQVGEVPTIPLPDQVVAMPAAKQDLPRISGARDPISQNYWKQMYPPIGGPMGLNPGLPYGYPPGVMYGVRPWGY